MKTLLVPALLALTLATAVPASGTGAGVEAGAAQVAAAEWSTSSRRVRTWNLVVVFRSDTQTDAEAFLLSERCVRRKTSSGRRRWRCSYREDFVGVPRDRFTFDPLMDRASLRMPGTAIDWVARGDRSAPSPEPYADGEFTALAAYSERPADAAGVFMGRGARPTREGVLIQAAGILTYNDAICLVSNCWSDYED